MHVCHLCDTSVASEYFRSIAARLIENGDRMTLVELGPGSAPDWVPTIPGLVYFSLGAAGKLNYPMAALRLARFLKREKVDILQTHLFFSGLIAVALRRLRIKTQITLMRHHTGVVRMLGSRFHVAADKWMAENADHVLTVSEAARRHMLDVDGIRRSDIEVVYLGFNFEKLAPNDAERRRVRRELGFADEDVVIGYVANFVPGKGHADLVAAFSKMVERSPHARLLLVGRGRLGEVDEAASALPSGKIEFAGWRDDVAACLNAMDIFVQPSRSEAFSQVLVEAMGVGLPVIATNVGGAAEVITNEDRGVLVEPGNSEALSTEIQRLYSDPQLRSRMADAGRASVTSRFTLDRMVARHQALYAEWMA